MIARILKIETNEIDYFITYTLETLEGIRHYTKILHNIDNSLKVGSWVRCTEYTNLFMTEIDSIKPLDK